MKKSEFIIDVKSFLYGVDATKRSLKFRKWGLAITYDTPDHWNIWNVVNGYWTTVIEYVGEATRENDGYYVSIDADLTDELKYLCMRDAGEVLEEGIANYLQSMKEAMTRL